MTSIERARQFIQNKGRTIALTLVPLASLAVVSLPAKAGPITPAVASLVFDATTCTPTAHGGSLSSGGSCLVSQLAPANGITGVALSGNGSVTSGISGGTISMEFSASGGANGASFVGGSFPLHYDVVVTDTDSDTLTYSLTLSFLTGVGTVPLAPITGTIPAGGGTLSGSPAPTLPPTPAVSGYSVDFVVSDSEAPADATLSVNVPAGQSIDVGAIGAPEPATFPLVASAIAGLMWWRRRKKA